MGAVQVRAVSCLMGQGYAIVMKTATHKQEVHAVTILKTLDAIVS